MSATSRWQTVGTRNSGGLAPTWSGRQSIQPFIGLSALPAAVHGWVAPVAHASDVIDVNDFIDVNAVNKRDPEPQRIASPGR